MELNVGPNHDWSIHSRVEDQVNNHMADIAVETLQQRLSSVSDQMHTLAGHVSQRSAEEFKEEPRTEDFRRGEEPLSSACGTGAPDRFTIAAPTGSTECDLSCLPETPAQRKIITLLVEIKEEQQMQWAVLRDLQARLQGPTIYEEEDMEGLDMDLPLNTLEQLDQIEALLENSRMQKRMVSYLSKMGGATVEDAVRRLMQAVLSFAVGSELNWVGRGQKRSFRNTRLQGVLFRALKRTPVGKEATQHQYADVVKKWLRFAPFRHGGTGRRCSKAPVEFSHPNKAEGFN